MRNLIKTLALLSLVIVVFPSCAWFKPIDREAAVGPSIHCPPCVPYYRFFRGVKKNSVSESQMLSKATTLFAPVKAQSDSKPSIWNVTFKSLDLFVAAPPSKPGAYPDLFALGLYQTNDEEYARYRNSLEGQKSASLYWDAFDKSKSMSTGAIPFSGIVADDVAYDAMSERLDWAQGETRFYLGVRERHIPREEFLFWLGRFIADLKETAEPLGLKGLVFVSSGDYLAVFENWASTQALADAVKSLKVQALTVDLNRHAKQVVDQAVVKANGQVEAGKIVRF